MYVEELSESLIRQLLREKSYQKQSVMLLWNPIVSLPLLPRSHLTYTWKDSNNHNNDTYVAQIRKCSKYAKYKKER